MLRIRLNRTIVGLKSDLPLTRYEHDKEGLNRTIVGLKFLLLLLYSTPEICLNRTIVGLKSKKSANSEILVHKFESNYSRIEINLNTLKTDFSS